VTGTVAVVGASLAGLSAARALRGLGYDGRVVLIGDEPHRPYDRPPLSKDFLQGTSSLADIGLEGPDDAALDLDWRLATVAVGLDPHGRSVLLADGSEVRADGVVIATGARAPASSSPRAPAPAPSPAGRSRPERTCSARWTTRSRSAATCDPAPGS
jgi:NADPH-dependent 2,4-dienoyl-CoA reductase/sulfur reductase-like enzyme